VLALDVFIEAWAALPLCAINVRLEKLKLVSASKKAQAVE
jgi:hypothetical protein